MNSVYTTTTKQLVEVKVQWRPSTFSNGANSTATTFPECNQALEVPSRKGVHFCLWRPRPCAI